MEALGLILLWTPSYMLLLLADFNLYPTPVINHNYKYNRFQ